jgi:hypothetical protein
MKIGELTNDQLNIIADNLPKWMAEYHSDRMGDGHSTNTEVPENIISLLLKFGKC